MSQTEADKRCAAVKRAHYAAELERQYRREQQHTNAIAQQPYASTAAWFGAIAAQPEPGHDVWAPDRWPRVAMVRRDRRAILHWLSEVRDRTDEQLVQWLRDSHKPLARRPPNTPDFTDILAITARGWLNPDSPDSESSLAPHEDNVRKSTVSERLDSIRQSRNTRLQKQLAVALSPTVRGRRPTTKPTERITTAREYRARLTREIQELQLRSQGAVTYRADLRVLVEREIPNVPAHVRVQLIGEIGVLNKKPSQAAAAIVASKTGWTRTAISHGKGPKVPRGRRAPRVISTDNIEMFERFAESGMRGKKRRQ